MKGTGGNRPLRAVAAPDSFKGSLSAQDAALAVERGIRSVCPEADIVRKPVADGGEGTVDAVLASAEGARRVTAAATGPLGAPVIAGYAMLPGGPEEDAGARGGVAVIELSAASGLTLVPEPDRRPLEATTFGTGELVRDALARGCRRIVLGLGGSATTDGGTGLLRALGFRFLDASGAELGPGGAELERLAAVDRSGADPRLAGVSFVVCCDVDNPLCGPQGAAAVYGPQKGASPPQVERLDAALRRLGRILEAEPGGEGVCSLPGGGAAGGTGAGLAALLGAELRPGFPLLAELAGLEEAIAGADLVVTGEGRTDGQTLRGKAPAGVVRLARRHGVPAVVISGGIGPGADALYAEGAAALLGIADRPMPLAEAVANAGPLLERAAANAVRLFLAGRGGRGRGRG